MLQIANILLYVSILSVLIPIFLLLRRKQSFKDACLKILGVLLFVSAFADLISFLLLKMSKLFIPILNFYTLIEFFLLSYIYFLLGKNKKVVFIIFILFAIFFVIDTICIEPFYEFQSLPVFIEGSVLIVYSVTYYIKTIRAIPPIDPFDSYPFWINSAIFYYFSFNMFLFIFGNYVYKNMPKDVSAVYWSFHNFNNIIKNIVFTVAIYIARKNFTK
ncbi:MAG: hypothetical protein IPJ81_16445 [Chitinophagaceae bacterium]|nr:hypothetical protein [Chitinophagaceae bacterium]